MPDITRQVGSAPGKGGQASRSRWFALAIPALLLVAYWAVGVLLAAGPVDDTYIFLRYAENLAQGHGPVFNVGERVEGYTSPLWLLCLGLLGTLQFDLVAAARSLSALFGAATILALFSAGGSCRTLGRQALAAVLGWFLATNPAFGYWAWSGMDTLLFTFLFFATFWVFLRQVQRPGAMWGAGLCFLLATSSRLDMLATLPVYLAGIASTDRRTRPLFRKAASFLAPQLLLVPHLLWRHAYYGSWLPNTYYAKADIPLPVLLASGAEYTAAFARAYAWLMVVVLLAVLTRLRLRGEVPLEWALPCALIGTWTLYVTYVGGDFFALFRFYLPLLPVLAWLCGTVLDWLATPLLAGRARYGPAALALLLLCLTYLNYAVYRDHGGPRARAEVALADYRVAQGEWFRAHAPNTATLAAVAIGGIAYASQLKTYDMVGLTDREVATRGKVYPHASVGHAKYHTDYILAQEPDYIVLLTGGETELSQQRPELLDQDYGYALYDLVIDPRTPGRYEYRAVRLADGRYIEFLQRKRIQRADQMHEPGSTRSGDD